MVGADEANPHLRRVGEPPLTSARAGHTLEVFLFFSNRLGCLGSLVVSVALTLLLLVVLGVIDV